MVRIMAQLSCHAAIVGEPNSILGYLPTCPSTYQALGALLSNNAPLVRKPNAV